MALIIVTGTPGTGKNEVAKVLSKETGFEYLDLEKFMKENELYDGYDKGKKCWVVDIDKLEFCLRRKVFDNDKDYIISSHIIQLVSSDIVDLCVVVKRDLKNLKKALVKRGYSKEKVKENMEAEIFENCLLDALNMGHLVVSVDYPIKKKSVKEIKEKLKEVKAGI